MVKKVINFFFSNNGVFTGVWLTTVIMFTLYIYFQGNDYRQIARKPGKTTNIETEVFLSKRK